jgi:hypothetical protein
MQTIYTRLKAALVLTLLNLREFLIAVDQGLNVVVCILTMRRAWSDETLSAHCWRSYKEGKLWGRFLMPPIDWLFSRQAVDPSIKDEAGQPIKGHCRRAYEKEKARDYLPPEYREAPTTDAK